MDGGPKDNANPVVREIDNKRGSRKRKPVGWREIEALSAARDIENAVIEDVGLYRSPVDRAVLQALTDVSTATKGEGVSLLKKVGLVIPKAASISTSRRESSPAFVPSNRTTPPVGDEDDENRDKLDADEIFEIIRNIQDPEHPLTLEQLGVVTREQIEVADILDSPEKTEDEDSSTVNIRFTPTVPHCSMATLIGLSIRVKLLRSLPPRFKISVRIEPGTHQSENSVNKQLGDKERVCAALENPHLLKVVNRCIRNGMTGP